MSECTYDFPESGTTPSLPWKSRNAMSKLGPSSNIGPLAPRPGTGNAKDEAKEKLVGSLMFLKNGHLRMSSSDGTQSSLGALKLKKESISNAEKINLERGFAKGQKFDDSEKA